MASRLLDSAKRAFHPLLADIYIYVDHRKGPAAGLSPGFGISLTAETAEGVVYSSDAVSHEAGAAEPSVPEDLGRTASEQLMESVFRVRT